MDPTTDIERQVISALREVASVTHADDKLLEHLIRNAQAGRATRPVTVERHRMTWIAPLLAAAVVAALATYVAVLVNLPQHHQPGTTSSPPAPTQSSTPTTPQANKTFRSLTCTVPLPSQWESALSSIVRPPGSATSSESSGLTILGMSPAGAVLASSDIGPHGQVVLVQPDRSARVLYQLPASLAGQSSLRIGGGQIDNQWAVFAVILGAGQGEIGAIDAVNLGTGAVTVVRDASLGADLIVSAPQLLDGHVYWSEVSNTGQGTVYDYDLTTRQRSTLATGNVYGPQVVGGAVEWASNGTVAWHGSPTLPVGFQTPPGKAVTLLQDGSTFAWTAWSGTGREQRQVIYMAKPGMQQPEIVYALPSTMPTLLALSGPYVIFNDTGITVLDTRTGAATTLTSPSPSTTAAAAGGVITLNVAGPQGGVQLVMIRADTLTGLRC